MNAHELATDHQVAPAVEAVSTPSPDVRDRALLRLGAVLGVTGVVVEVVMGVLHPHREDPNHSAAAFHEYTESAHWTLVHIGQFAGSLLIVLSLVALARSLSRQGGYAGAFAIFGALSAALVAGVFAVQMAVDGVALKGAIDSWASATTPAARETAFQVADGIRWVEKALSSFFQLLNGLTFLFLGLAVALSRSYARWLGVVGALTGLSLLYAGTVVARTGFSPEASTAVLPGTLLGLVFVGGAAVSMWRRGR